MMLQVRHNSCYRYIFLDSDYILKVWSYAMGGGGEGGIKDLLKSALKS